MPNLCDLAIIGCSSDIYCSDIESLHNSNIELVIIEKMGVIPDFIWKLPKLKKLLIRDLRSSFCPPSNTSIEDLILKFDTYTARNGTVSSIENLARLQTLHISHGSTIEISSSLIHHLKIWSFYTVTLGEMPSLRCLDITFSDRAEQLLTIEAIPNIEKFYVQRYDRPYQKNNLKESLLKASNATDVAFSCTASEIPAELTTWPNLKRFDFSSWNSIVEFPAAFQDWDIPEIVCVYPQIAINNFPENVQSLWLAEDLFKPNSNPVGLKRLQNLTRLTCRKGRSIEPYLKEIFECSTLQHLTLSLCGISMLPSSIKRLSNLISIDLKNNYKIQRLPDDIGSLTKLRYLNMSRTSIHALPLSIAQCTELQRLYYLSYQTRWNIVVYWDVPISDRDGFFMAPTYHLSHMKYSFERSFDMQKTTPISDRRSKCCTLIPE